jgi:hypothetical protein
VSAVLDALDGVAWIAENERRLEAAAQRLIDVAHARANGRDALYDGDRDTPLALDELARRFSLDPFERDLVLLCAVFARSAAFGSALNDAFASEVEGIDFRIAASILAQPRRIALSPAGALRRWHLVSVGDHASLDRASFELDERISFYLEAHSFLEPRLEGIVRHMRFSAGPKTDLADRFAAAIRNAAGPSSAPVMEFVGGNAAERNALFGAVATQLGLTPYVMAARDIPAQAAEREALARLWERESMLADGALLLDTRDNTPELLTRAREFVQSLEALVFTAGTELRPFVGRSAVPVRLKPREPAGELARWQKALGKRLQKRLNGSIERAAWQFSLDDRELASVAASVRAAPEEKAAEALWQSAREQARRGLEAVAPRLDSRVDWRDLVLPATQTNVLHSVAVHVRERHRVYREWGFADKSSRGLGISAMFTGASGTGKTLAAEVLASELGLDLHRIDLARVVSKYIGETEKNLAGLFDTAESSGAILLFDEADALFGKRSEVRDSHDRYANIEVSYLLQRMESYRGLSILTTNLKQGIDDAFLRRIRFIVHFPFPDDDARRDIWERVFPATVPREGLDLDKLARLNLSGGHIRSIALNAAFIAASNGQPVHMSHLKSAAIAEYAKLERAVPRADLRDWV